MRIQGRILRPATLGERRVLKALGLDSLKVRRGMNPFAVARHVRKLAVGRGGDLPALRSMLLATKPVPELPDSTNEPRTDGRGA
ncbi:MAG: hypothetical protein U0169_02265 [Polyangiaceae bacterium]